MKKINILLMLALLASGCGGSGDKASTTNPIGSTPPHVNTGSGNGGIGSGGSRTTPIGPGVTPYAHGENKISPRGDLYLEFNKDSSGDVFASGDLDLAQQFGFLNCILPVGSYDLSTNSPGREKLVVHNYGGVSISANGPVSFVANLENSLSMQNQNGEWVLHASLKLLSVGGVTCTYPSTLSFQMPLAR